MRHKTFIFLMCLMLVPAGAKAAEMYKLETIDRVLSGDTFRLEDHRRIIRLIGVDAHEIGTNSKAKKDARRAGLDVKEIIMMGKETLDWLKSRLEGRNVFLKYDKKKKDDKGAEWAYAFIYGEDDFYGGIIERESFEDVQFEWWESPERAEYVFVNATIIKAGHATPAPDSPNTKYADRFEELYWEAKENNEGLWRITDFFDVPCRKEGENVGNCAGCVIRCCKGTEPMFNQVINGKCSGDTISGDGGYCSNCGDNKCGKKLLEDSCNCPRDCD